MLPEYQVKEKDDPTEEVKRQLCGGRSDALSLASLGGRAHGFRPALLLGAWVGRSAMLGGRRRRFWISCASGFAILSAACHAGSPAPLRRVPTPLPPSRGGESVIFVMSRKSPPNPTPQGGGTLCRFGGAGFARRAARSKSHKGGGFALFRSPAALAYAPRAPPPWGFGFGYACERCRL